MAPITGNADGSVIIDTRMDTQGFHKGATSLKRELSGLGASVKKFGGLIAAAFSVKQVVNFAKESIKLGSDLQEVQNVVDVTFTTMNKQLNDFAKNAAKTAGLSETMAKRYAGTFGAMAKSFKFTEEEAFNMATALTQMSGDIASFYNLTQDEAYTKLKSVFTGETESLKDLGVVMTQTALDDFAMRKGFKKTTSQMSEQEKVALRYQFVMEQLNGASGDFLRTSNSWANQTRLLNLQFDQLKATIGKGLINALTPSVQVLNTIIEKLQVAADAFLAFTQTVFGDAGGDTSGVNKVGDSVEQMGNKIEEAGKKAKKALAPFDEITKISATMADNAADASQNMQLAVPGASNVTIGESVKDNISPVLDGIAKKLQELIAPLRDINFKPLLTEVGSLGESFSGLGETISKDLEWVWTEILVPFSKWAIEDLAPASVGALSSAFLALGKAVEPVKNGIKILWEAAQPAFSWLGEKAVGYINSLREGYDKMASVFEEKAATIEEIFSNLGEIFGTLWEAAEPTLDGLATGLKDFTETTFDALLENLGLTFEGIENITGALDAMLKGDWATAKTKLEAFFDTCIEKMKVFFGWWEKMYQNDWFKNFVDAFNNWAYSGGSTNNWYGIGGTSAAFSLQRPQLPHLAKGAVIPPNAPFAAVLGDQRHGTNIEAPLSTIQEAVAAVMSYFHAGNMAGHEATVSMLKEILEAILGIEIGDSVIGEAYERYNRKMSIVKGGA